MTEIKIKPGTIKEIIEAFDTGSPIEQGGILGKNSDGVICSFCFDSGAEAAESPDIYVPDTAYLNEVISKWRGEGISFCGLVHSHIHGGKLLSNADIRYAEKIIDCFDNLPSVIMGIVTAENRHTEITWYRVQGARYKRRSFKQKDRASKTVLIKPKQNKYT